MIHMKNKITKWFIISCIITVAIMLFSKLFPFIKCSWSADFCKDWNDFWFGFSCSLLCSFIVAYLMYYYTDFRPRKVFSIQVKPILKRKLEIMHQTYDFVFRKFGGLGDFEKSDNENLAQLLRKNIWADKIEGTEHTYNDVVQETMIELRRIIAEFLTYSKYLEDYQIFKLEEIVNMAYCGIQIAKKCTTDSSGMQKSLVTGNVLINWLQLYERDTFVDEVFIPSYRKLLEIEKSFNTEINNGKKKTN